MSKSLTTMYAPPVPARMLAGDSSFEVTRGNIRRIIRGMLGSKTHSTFFAPYSESAQFYPDSCFDVNPMKVFSEEWLPELLAMLNSYGDWREQLAKKRASAAL